jgi:ABC-type lipoprotein release transport system permease subunit
MAWRNIWRNPTRSLVVIGAVSIGIWAAIALSGFTQGIVKSYVNNAVENIISHVQIHHPAFLGEYEVEHYLPDALALERALREQEGVEAASIRTLSNAMIASSRGTRGVRIKGVVPEDEARVSGLRENIIEGDYFPEDGRNPLLIGSNLAEKLGVKLRSRVVLTFQDLDGEITSAAFRIVGVFKTGNNPFDQGHVFVRRDDLNRLLVPPADTARAAMPEALAHEAALMTRNLREVDALAIGLRAQFSDLEVRTYREISPDINLYEEQLGSISLVYLVIIMLALVFGIINTMLMAVLERIKELGMLMAIGMNKLRVFSMILLEAMLLGLVGLPIGLLLSYLTISRLENRGIDLSAYARSLENYGMSPIIYFEVDPAVYLQVGIGVLITSLLAAIYPALKAIRLRPIEALQKV